MRREHVRTSFDRYNAVYAEAWPTLDELRELALDPITPTQALAGFSYRGLGLYQHTSPNADDRVGPRPRTSVPHWATDERTTRPLDTRPRARAREWSRRVAPIDPLAMGCAPLALAFIRAIEFPRHIVVVRWQATRAYPIGCLYDSLRDMFVDMQSRGHQWFGRSVTRNGSDDAVVLGAWR